MDAVASVVVAVRPWREGRRQRSTAIAGARLVEAPKWRDLPSGGAAKSEAGPSGAATTRKRRCAAFGMKRGISESDVFCSGITGSGTSACHRRVRCDAHECLRGHHARDGGGTEPSWPSPVGTRKLDGVARYADLADGLARIANGLPNLKIDDLLPWADVQLEPLRDVA